MTRLPAQFEINMDLKQNVVLNSVGVSFYIYDKRDGKETGTTEMLGTLIISGGGIRFIPAGHRRAYRIKWGELTEILKVFGHLS